MKKLLLILLFALSTLSAKLCIEPPTPKFLTQKIKIIDIRTAGEWKETGIIKGSIPITFFKEDGSYDIATFVNEVKKFVKPGETFAMICRSGSRTSQISAYLALKNDPVVVKALGQEIHIIDLTGGIIAAQQNGIKLVPFK